MGHSLDLHRPRFSSTAFFVMFRSLASSLLSFLAILLLAFVFVLLWSGSEGLTFTRAELPGDRTTVAVIAEYVKANTVAETEVKMEVEEPADAPMAGGGGNGANVVLWLSVPGFRNDYLEKAETPYLDQLVADGGSTNKMRPSFPCTTFPAHATMATGVLPSVHGIVADQLRLAEGQVEPITDGSKLLVEPIWTTATRQGVKTLVHDWPLSTKQAGENAAAISLDSLNPELNDEARFTAAFEAWKAHSAAATAPDGTDKLRLVMLRLTDVLQAGLVHGPRGDDTYKAVTAFETSLKSFVEKVQAEWAALAPPDANLIIFLTTDHGMTEVEKNINLVNLLGPEMMANAEIVSHDAVANLYFKALPANEGEKKLFLSKFDSELGKRIYFRTIRKEELPPEWSYAHPERTGDRVLVLKSSYAFTDVATPEAVSTPTESNGHFGAFGYPVEESSRMSGQVILSGYPKSPAAGDLGEVGQLSFHATVCKLLGIEPAAGAVTDTLTLR